MRSLFVAVAVAVLGCFASAAFAADPTGTYNVQGKNPSGTSYEGTVTVTNTGDTYKVVWQVGGSTYTGTAIGNKDFLGVSYQSGDNTGLALYGEDGGNWNGVWTYAGGTSIGTEVWKRQ
jgi:hypothetical protein